jgi:hypothetical protein
MVDVDVTIARGEKRKRPSERRGHPRKSGTPTQTNVTAVSRNRETLFRWEREVPVRLGP